MSFAESTPPADVMARDSRDRPGFKATGSVEVAPSRPEEDGVWSGNLVGEHTTNYKIKSQLYYS